MDNWNNWNANPNNNNMMYTSMMPRQQLPKMEIIKVNGKNGAEAFQMAPNSNILLLDETNPIVWLAQTDGAGYKTVTPYTITPYQPKPEVDLHSLEERLTRLEEMFNEQSNNGQAKSKKRQQYIEQQSVNSTN